VRRSRIRPASVASRAAARFFASNPSSFGLSGLLLTSIIASSAVSNVTSSLVGFRAITLTPYGRLRVGFSPYILGYPQFLFLFYSRSITINMNDPGNTGGLPLPGVPAGTGPNFAETRNTR